MWVKSRYERTVPWIRHLRRLLPCHRRAWRGVFAVDCMTTFLGYDWKSPKITFIVDCKCMREQCWGRCESCSVFFVSSRVSIEFSVHIFMNL